MSPKLGDEGLKSFKDLARQLLDEPLEPVDGRESLGVPVFQTNAQRYYRGAADLHLHFRLLRHVRGPEMLLGDYCAVLTKAARDPAIGQSADAAETSFDVPDARDDGDQVPVFVAVRQATENHEGVIIWRSERSTRLHA